MGLQDDKYFGTGQKDTCPLSGGGEDKRMVNGSTGVGVEAGQGADTGHRWLLGLTGNQSTGNVLRVSVGGESRDGNHAILTTK